MSELFQPLFAGVPAEFGPVREGPSVVWSIASSEATLPLLLVIIAALLVALVYALGQQQPPRRTQRRRRVRTQRYTRYAYQW